MIGQPLVNLPQLDYRLIKLKFKPMERVVYCVVRARFIAKLNSWSMNNKMARLRASIFALLTRLRQLCSHFCLILHIFKDLLEVEDVENLIHAHEKYGTLMTGRSDVLTTKSVRKVLE